MLARVGLSIVGVILVVSACGSDDLLASGSTVSADPLPDAVAEAFGLLPASVGQVSFADVATSLRRQGYSRPDAASREAILKDIATAGTSASASELFQRDPLIRHLGAMVKAGAAVTALDVAWSAQVTSFADDEVALGATLYRLRPDIDVADVVADFADAGFEKDVQGDWTTLTMEGLAAEKADPTTQLVGDRYPLELADDQVAVLEEPPLLVTGDFELLDDEDARLSSRVQPLLDVAATEEPEFLEYDAGSTLDCWEPADAWANNSLSVQDMRTFVQTYPVVDLGRPEDHLFTASPEHGALTVDRYPSEREAVVTEAGREDVYEIARTDPAPIGVVLGRAASGSDPRIEPGWTMQRDGAILTVRHNPTAWESALTLDRAGFGFAACNPLADYLAPDPEGDQA